MAVVPWAAAMPSATRCKPSRSCWRVRADTARMVPWISATSGMTLKVVPAEMRPTVITPGSKASSVRVQKTWRACTISQAMGMGSRALWGADACPPLPWTVTRNWSAEAICAPPSAMSPAGSTEKTWMAKAPVTGRSGATSRRPSSSMYWAPWWPSSPGWNMNRTLPARSACRDESSFAAVTSIVVCRSWPHACMVSSRGDAKSSPVSSCIGSASMSPRRMMVGPGRAPSRVATTLVVESPVRHREGQAVEGLEHPLLGEGEVESELGVLVQRAAQSGRLRTAGPGLRRAGCRRPWGMVRPCLAVGPTGAGGSGDRDLRPGILSPSA